MGYTCRFSGVLILTINFLMISQGQPASFYGINWTVGDPIVIYVRILAEEEIYPQFPYSFWAAQIQELNLLFQTLPNYLYLVLVPTTVELANVS